MSRHRRNSMTCSSDLIPLACFSGNVESVAALMESADRTAWTTSDIRLGLAIAISCGYDDIVDHILDSDCISSHNDTADVDDEYQTSRIQSYLSDSAMHKLTRIQMFSKHVLEAKKELANITELVDAEYDNDDNDDYSSSDDEHSCYRGISEDDYSISGSDDFEIGSSSESSSSSYDDDDERCMSAPDELCHDDHRTDDDSDNDSIPPEDDSSSEEDYA